MNRRTFMGGVALGFVTTPLAVCAQQPPKVARIGYLATGPLESPEQRSGLDAFRQGLTELGYVEGQNIVLEVRHADGKIEWFPSRASELVRLKPDLIVATNTPAARAAQQATTTVPIVVPVMGDSVGDGLARPGGNITGLAFIGPQLVPKRMALLKEALATIAGERADALIVFPSPMLFTERKHIVDLAAKQRLPSMSQDRGFVARGRGDPVTSETALA